MIACIQCLDVDFQEPLYNYTKRVYSKRYNLDILHGHFEPTRWAAAIKYHFPNTEVRYYEVNGLSVKAVVDNLVLHGAHMIFMSCMSTNVHIINDVLSLLQGSSIEVIIGGYDNPDRKYKANYTFVYNINEIGVINRKHTIGYDYSIFANERCIPRITTQEGCSNYCTFCNIPSSTKRKFLSTKDVVKQIIELDDIKFDYLYIDDKTFDCNSYDMLAKIDYIFTNRFKYIIQTTPVKYLQLVKEKDLDKLDIAYVELGMETLNDDVLKNYTGKSTLYIARKCMCANATTRHKIIPNLILNLPNDDGFTTLEFMQDFGKQISHYNLSWYADYSKGEAQVIPKHYHPNMDKIIKLANEQLNI